MSTDHSKTIYYESVERDDGWGWKVYHYDATGNRQVIMGSGGPHDEEPDALDAATDWCEERDISAKLA